jgi:hypothetical protein
MCISMDGETQVVQRRRSRVSWMHTGVWIKVIFQIPYREIPLNRVFHLNHGTVFWF